MNNQGLEALANLASASPPQTTDGTASNNASRAERPYVQQATGEHGNQQHPAPAPPASAVHVPPAQPTTQPALSLNSLSTQQLQQLLTAAGGGNNAVQSLLSAGNLNLLGLQQLDTSVLSQLAYLQQLLGLTGSVPNVHPFTNPSGSLLYNNVAVPPPAAAVAAAAAQETVRGELALTQHTKTPRRGSRWYSTDREPHGGRECTCARPTCLAWAVLIG